MAFDLEKFNTQVYTALTETVDQQLELFNQASDNTLVLAPSTTNMGDYSFMAGFKAIKDLVRRRDVNNGDNPVTPVRLHQYKTASVKVAAGSLPVVFEPAQYRWVQQSPEEAAVVIGEQLSAGMLQDQLNTAVSALVAAISGNTAVTNTVTTTANFAALTATAAKFGDRLSSIAAWVVHSKVMTDIWQDTLKNSERLFDYDNVAVMRDQFGRRFIMSDIPALAIEGDGGGYYSLGLVRDAAIVAPNNDFDALMESETRKENLQRIYQSEWSYNLSLKGYSWNTTAGGSSPTDTAIGTSANWEKIATSDKDTAGVLLQSA